MPKGKEKGKEADTNQERPGYADLMKPNREVWSKDYPFKGYHIGWKQPAPVSLSCLFIG